MEQPKSAWNEYYEHTEGMQPRRFLKKALQYVHEKGAALDLGAGVLSDSKYLLQEGFRKVTAVDNDPMIRKFAEQITDDRFTCDIASFETYEFPKDAYDLVSAQYSLPFIKKESFEQVLANIKQSIKKDGVFAVQLFGPHNGSFKTAEIVRFAREEIETMFADMEIIELHEKEGDGTIATGSPIHWDIFYIMLRKK